MDRKTENRARANRLLALAGQPPQHTDEDKEITEQERALSLLQKLTQDSLKRKPKDADDKGPEFWKSEWLSDDDTEEANLERAKHLLALAGQPLSLSM